MTRSLIATIGVAINFVIGSRPVATEAGRGKVRLLPVPVQCPRHRDVD